MENADKPAFSTQHTIDGNWNTEPDRELMGLTKREYFAAMSMQSLVSHYGCTDDRYKNDKIKPLAEKSILIADELLKQLES